VHTVLSWIAGYDGIMPRTEEVMGTLIETVNYIKTCPLKSWLFAEWCKEMGTQYQSVLYYCNSHWLSREKFFAPVYNLREGVACFYEDENMLNISQWTFCFLISILEWYFWEVQIFEPKGARERYIIVVTSRVKIFIGKLRLWVRKL
jgi:hypothetical protein